MLYDMDGVIGFIYNNATYYYRKTFQGDVEQIVNLNGAVVAAYTYDAWGAHKVLYPDGTENTSSTFIGYINPIRYRSYYHDNETKLYYLQSRYYDPEIGRFLNADDVDYLEPEELNGLNLYAYCYNNPVIKKDPDGKDAILIVDFDEYGLKKVGHAVLLIQDASGVWWITEFTGSTKKNASVRCSQLSSTSTRFENEEGILSFLNQMEGNSGTQKVYLKGDYTQSLELAKNYANSGDYSKYNLLTNNCLDYIQILLKEGENNNSGLQSYFERSKNVVPLFFTANVAVMVSEKPKLIKALFGFLMGAAWW